jgi:molecular chaperone DnaK (HSP70)
MSGGFLCILVNYGLILQVILCGGCCRIPLLQQQVQEYFSTAEFLQGIAPDEVLAVGCAVQVGYN